MCTCVCVCSWKGSWIRNYTVILPSSSSDLGPGSTCSAPPPLPLHAVHLASRWGGGANEFKMMLVSYEKALVQCFPVHLPIIVRGTAGWNNIHGNSMYHIEALVKNILRKLRKHNIICADICYLKHCSMWCFKLKKKKLHSRI